MRRLAPRPGPQRRPSHPAGHPPAPRHKRAGVSPLLLATVLLALGHGHVASAQTEAGQNHNSQTNREAEALSARFASLRDGLRAEGVEARRSAIEAYQRLSIDPSQADEGEALRSHVDGLIRRRPTHDEVERSLNSFWAHAPRTESARDRAQGIGATLDETHRAQVVKVAETLLLWRALENNTDVASQEQLLRLVTLDGGLWLSEARNLVRRGAAGARVLLILAEVEHRPALRQWVSWAQSRLPTQQPGELIQDLNDDALRDVLHAYAATRLRAAMPIVVGLLAHPSLGVRRAAEGALSAYGRRAIWVLREAYHTQVGAHAPEAWGWQRVSRELQDALGTADRAAIAQHLEAATEARRARDFQTMQAQLDRALLYSLSEAERILAAESYAVGAQQQLDGRHFQEAERLFARAARLAPEHDGAPGWRARIRLCQSEEQLQRGILNLEGYRAALALDPNLERATEVIEASEVRAPQPPSLAAQIAPWAASLCFLLLGLFLLRSPRSTPGDSPTHSAVSGEEEPGREDVASFSEELNDHNDHSDPLSISTLNAGDTVRESTEESPGDESLLTAMMNESTPPIQERSQRR